MSDYSGKKLAVVLGRRNPSPSPSGPHQQWSNQQLIELMDRNFPELLEGSNLKSETLKPTGLSMYYSDADVQKMRNAGINTLTQTSSGRIISSPRGGTNLNRKKGQKSIKVAQASIDVPKVLKEVECEINRQAQAAGIPDGGTKAR